MSESSHAFKVGDRVKIYNGGRLEGTATIKGLCSTPDDYHVHFDGDHPQEFWRRTVMPHWQEEGFSPEGHERHVDLSSFEEEGRS